MAEGETAHPPGAQSLTIGPEFCGDAAIEEPGGRWDVGLGDRLAQTILKWLGRQAGTNSIGLPASVQSSRWRRAA